MPQLQRFWFEFAFDTDNKIWALGLGCGVTAWSYDDALNILKEKIFKDIVLPKVEKVIEGVDVSTLDKGHVVPNMLPSNNRGIWYPISY